MNSRATAPRSGGRDRIAARVAEGAVIAAAYAALTIYVAPVAFGPYQLRISEILKPLVIWEPHLIPAFVLGNFLGNRVDDYELVVWKARDDGQGVNVDQVDQHVRVGDDDPRPVHPVRSLTRYRHARGLVRGDYAVAFEGDLRSGPFKHQGKQLFELGARYLLPIKRFQSQAEKPMPEPVTLS